MSRQHARIDASDGVSRRGFLGAVAGASVLGAASGRASAQAETIRLGGEVPGWQGAAPPSIEGETNPTLYLEVGSQYEVVWENLDGAPHNFTIEDADGNVLQATETMTDQGQTRSLTFTATEQMTTYICTIHPTTMVGDISFSAPPAEDGGGPTIPPALLTLGIGVAMAVLSPIIFALVMRRYYRDERQAPPE